MPMPVADNMMAADAGDSGIESASEMTRKPAPTPEGGWKLESVTLEPAANGGIIARCSLKQDPMPKDGPGYKSDNYAFSSVDEAVEFVRRKFAGPTAAGSTGGASVPVPARAY